MATNRTGSTNSTKKRATKGSSAKGSGAKKGNSSSYKTAYEQHQHSVRQMAAIVMFTVGILLLSIELIPGTGVWLWLKNLMFGLFGLIAFLVPAALIYIAVMAATDKPIGKIKHKIWQAGVLVSLFCGLIEISSKTAFEGADFFNSVSNLYIKGQAFKSGGVFSSIIGWPLLATCGKVGAIIIIVLFLFAFLMLLSGTTLIDFFKSVAKPVKKIEETYTQIQENKTIAKQRFDIDVDLGPEAEMPEHPVAFKKPTVDELLELEQQETERIKSKAKAEKVIEMSKVINSQNELKAEKLADTASSTDKIPLTTVEEVETPEEKAEDNAEPENEGIHLYTDENNELNRYIFPPVSLLKAPKNEGNRDVSDELNKMGEMLVATLKSFGVQTKIINISRGPTVTRYELQPSAGVKISKITGLADDIALNLAAAGVRIEAPIPNKPAVGIEVPNKMTDIVTMREIIESQEYDKAKSKISIALGKDIAGACVVADVGKMPHMLIAGATGSGKSVCINSIIMSILYKASPSEVRFLMVDPKVVELGVYNGIPHLLVPVVTDPRKAAGALAWAVTEMLNRYKLFAENNVRDLASYNQLAKENEEIDPMPQIVIIIDELADLMMAAPNEVEDTICRLAQMARAAGMHLIIATQRPSVDIITGVIKANIPSRIAFAVSSQVDSRTILDGAGAEKLLGRGDMLFYPVGVPKPIRVQGCYVSDKEIESVVNFVKNKESADYDNKIIEEIEKQAVPEKNTASAGGNNASDSDEMLEDAIECVIEAGQASTSYLQRKLKVGYARAARLIDDMEERGIVGPFEGSKPRQVQMSRQQWIEMKMQKDVAAQNSATVDIKS